MTRDEIDIIFPPGFSGIAQISDLRLLLSKLANSDQLGGIEFYEVQDISERDQLEAQDGDISKVALNNQGKPETYIMSNSSWKILVEIPVGGGSGPGTQYVKLSQNFDISQLDEDFQELALSQIPTIYDHIFVIINGMIQMEGPQRDFTRVGNLIHFSPGSIIMGDSVQIKYSYIS